MKNNAFYNWEGNNLILNVFVSPGSKNDAFGKIYGNMLKISIKKAPEHGEATKYLIKFLADTFKVPKKNVELLYGETNRSKSLKIISPKKIPKELNIKI